MPKLNQINALVTGRKGVAEKYVGDLYKLLQKPELFNGRNRTYKPYDDVNGEKLPAESQKVQFNLKEMLTNAAAMWTELWDLTGTQDAGNQSARADVVVDGKTVMAGVPVTTLLFLEKQVNDVETFLSKLPVPDSQEDWTHDPNQGLLRSRATESLRTKKEPAHHEKAPATKEHPAQVEFFWKDVPVGTWTTVLFSGALPADQKKGLMARVKKLKDAIKTAREEANSIDVKVSQVGAPLFAYLLGE